jgi:hypothetical protein
MANPDSTPNVQSPSKPKWKRPRPTNSPNPQPYVQAVKQTAKPKHYVD